MGILFAQQINKSAKLDKEATKKNIKAFTKIADANARLEKCQSDLLNQLQINAKRKNGLITYHLSMFQEQYSIIRKIQFGRGKGIEEIEKLGAGGLNLAARKGDVEMGSVMIGQIAGMLNEIKPVQEIIDDIVNNLAKVMENTQNICK